MSGPVKLFFDGGLRPSGMELAVVVGGRVHIERDLGPGTSMEAEWLALLAAIRVADRMAVRDAVLLGDAAAVIAQAAGRVRVPPACRGLARQFHDLPRGDGRLRLRYVRRAQNLAGIALERSHCGRQPFALLD